MPFDRFLGYFPDVVITDVQAAACRYLERRGQRFLVDFGYENAIDKAMDQSELEHAGRVM